MTTIVAALCPWNLPVSFPVEGIAVVADTRTTFLPRGSVQAYDYSWKVVDLDEFALCAYAGNQKRALMAIASLSGYLQRHPRPDASKARFHLLQLLHKSAAKTPPRLAKDPAQDFQILIGYLHADGNPELLFFNQKGLVLTELSNSKGPFAFGSGVSTPKPFIDEVSTLVQEQNEKNMVGSGGLVHGAHLLAAAFSNTFLNKEADESTGGGIVIVTLSAKHGLQYFTFSELEGEIAEMENPEELWKHRSPEVVTASALYQFGQSSLGRTLHRGEIVSLLGDDRNKRLSILTKAVTQKATVTVRRG